MDGIIMNHFRNESMDTEMQRLTIWNHGKCSLFHIASKESVVLWRKYQQLIGL